MITESSYSYSSTGSVLLNGARGEVNVNVLEQAADVNKGILQCYSQISHVKPFSLFKQRSFFYKSLFPQVLRPWNTFFWHILKIYHVCLRFLLFTVKFFLNVWLLHFKCGLRRKILNNICNICRCVCLSLFMDSWAMNGTVY